MNEMEREAVRILRRLVDIPVELRRKRKEWREAPQELGPIYAVAIAAAQYEKAALRAQYDVLMQIHGDPTKNIPSGSC